MNKMIEAEFKFHPVGQGGFYTGEIKINKRQIEEFNFVYDCGAILERNKIQESIELYRNGHNKKLDVLVLSHLDDDHVNGVKQLLEGKICKHIYLPYLNPIQRLFVAIRHVETDTPNYDDFIDFLVSPHNYLLNIEGVSVEEIVYILGNQDGDYTTDDSPKEPINIDDQKFNFEDSLEIIKPEDLLSDMRDINGAINKTKIVFKKGNNTVRLGLIWEFYLYNELAKENKTEKYEIAVKKICGLSESDKLCQSDLERILSDSEKLKELRDTYRDIFKNLNKTGLVIQHKPLSYSKAYFIKRCNTNFHHHYFNRYSSSNSHLFSENKTMPINYKWGVTLLTGDISLDQIENSHYIKDHLSECLVFQVPHHGSKTGWDASFLQCLNNNAKTSAIINFGYGNIFGHPRYSVLKDLDDNNISIQFCTQFEVFNYYMNLQF